MRYLFLAVILSSLTTPLFADTFTVNISTSDVALIQRFQPDVQKHIERIIELNINGIKESLIKIRLRNPQERDRLINEIIKEPTR